MIPKQIISKTDSELKRINKKLKKLRESAEKDLKNWERINQCQKDFNNLINRLHLDITTDFRKDYTKKLAKKVIGLFFVGLFVISIIFSAVKILS